MPSSPSHIPASPEIPERETLAAPEVVWGAPSDEMLEAENRGDIVLVEDISQAGPGFIQENGNARD